MISSAFLIIEIYKPKASRQEPEGLEVGKLVPKIEQALCCTHLLFLPNCFPEFAHALSISLEYHNFGFTAHSAQTAASAAAAVSNTFFNFGHRAAAQAHACTTQHDGR
jgi:hypothetical protein